MTSDGAGAPQRSITITDHGRPSHVFMTAEEFERLSGAREWRGIGCGHAARKVSTSSCLPVDWSLRESLICEIPPRHQSRE